MQHKETALIPAGSEWVWRSQTRGSLQPRLSSRPPASVSCRNANYGVRKLIFFFSKDINQTYKRSMREGRRERETDIQLGIAMKEKMHVNEYDLLTNSHEKVKRKHDN